MTIDNKTMHNLVINRQRGDERGRHVEIYGPVVPSPESIAGVVKECENEGKTVLNFHVETDKDV